MAEIGDGPIEADLRRVLDQIDRCLTVLREKVDELSVVKGIERDDDGQ